MFKEILKDKFAGPALIILLVMYLCIACADFISPYSKDFSDRNQAYAPPSPIYTVTEEGKLSFPYTYNYIRVFEPKLYQNVYQLDRSKKHYLKLFVKAEQYNILGIIPCSIHLLGTDEGGRLYLLGTDINGRDVFSRLLFGGRISLTIGFLALFILFPIGLLVFLVDSILKILYNITHPMNTFYRK